MILTGFIQNTSSRSGTGRNGKKWTAYNAEIRDVDGVVTKLSFGFTRPTVSEGDFVSLDAFDKDGFLTVDESTIQRKDPPKQAPQGTSGNGVIDSAQGNYAEEKPAQFNRQTNPVDAARMTYNASRDAAIAVVDLLLRNDALVHSKAKNKGGEAQRYAEITAALDKLTVRFYHDAMAQRLLDVVADEGIIDTAPSSQLPEDDETQPNPLDE